MDNRHHNRAVNQQDSHLPYQAHNHLVHLLVNLLHNLQFNHQAHLQHCLQLYHRVNLLVSQVLNPAGSLQTFRLVCLQVSHLLVPPVNLLNSQLVVHLHSLLVNQPLSLPPSQLECRAVNPAQLLVINLLLNRHHSLQDCPPLNRRAYLLRNQQPNRAVYLVHSLRHDQVANLLQNHLPSLLVNLLRFHLPNLLCSHPQYHLRNLLPNQVIYPHLYLAVNPVINLHRNLRHYPHADPRLFLQASQLSNQLQYLQDSRLQFPVVNPPHNLLVNHLLNPLHNHQWTHQRNQVADRPTCLVVNHQFCQRLNQVFNLQVSQVVNQPVSQPAILQLFHLASRRVSQPLCQRHLQRHSQPSILQANQLHNQLESLAGSLHAHRVVSRHLVHQATLRLNRHLIHRHLRHANLVAHHRLYQLSNLALHLAHNQRLRQLASRPQFLHLNPLLSQLEILRVYQHRNQAICLLHNLQSSQLVVLQRNLVVYQVRVLVRNLQNVLPVNHRVNQLGYHRHNRLVYQPQCRQANLPPTLVLNLRQCRQVNLVEHLQQLQQISRHQPLVGNQLLNRVSFHLHNHLCNLPLYLLVSLLHGHLFSRLLRHRAIQLESRVLSPRVCLLRNLHHILPINQVVDRRGGRQVNQAPLLRLNQVLIPHVSLQESLQVSHQINQQANLLRYQQVTLLHSHLLNLLHSRLEFPLCNRLLFLLVNLLSSRAVIRRVSLLRCLRINQLHTPHPPLLDSPVTDHHRLPPHSLLCSHLRYLRGSRAVFLRSNRPASPLNSRQASLRLFPVINRHVDHLQTQLVSLLAFRQSNPLYNPLVSQLLILHPSLACSPLVYRAVIRRVSLLRCLRINQLHTPHLPLLDSPVTDHHRLPPHSLLCSHLRYLRGSRAVILRGNQVVNHPLFRLAYQRDSLLPGLLYNLQVARQRYLASSLPENQLAHHLPFHQRNLVVSPVALQQISPLTDRRVNHQ